MLEDREEDEVNVYSGQNIEGDIQVLTFGEYSDTINDTCHLEVYDSDEEHSEFHVVNKCNCTTCWHYKYCIICTYMLLLIIIVAALIALTVVVLFVVIPLARTAHFQESICNVTRTSHHMEESSCSCGKGCDSHFPCLHIDVHYYDNMSVLHNASMYDDEVILNKQVNTSPS